MKRRSRPLYGGARSGGECGLTWRVTSLSSIITSLVRKSAPMVALYVLSKRFCTYWFIRHVFPTLR